MKSSKYSAVSILMSVLITSFIIFDYFSNRSSAHFVPSVLPKGSGNDREVINIDGLQTLLDSEGLTVTGETLLPASYKGSLTMLMHLNAASLVSGGDPGQYRVQAESYKATSATIRRQRNLELASTQLLILAVDNKKNVLWWHFQPSPRILRAEFANENGDIEGETKFFDNASFLISLPNETALSQIRIYRPVWSGSYRLELLGTLGLEGLQEMQYE